MESELLVCSSSYAEWIEQVENDKSTSEFNSIDELMEGVGSSVNHLDLPVIFQSDVVPNSILQTDSSQIQVEVEVHSPPPPPSSSNRGRGKGSRGGRGKGRGGGGRGTNCRRSSRPPPHSVVTEVVQTSHDVTPSQPVLQEVEERRDGEDTEDREESQAVDQLLEGSSDSTPTKVKKTLIEQLRNQFSFSESNVLRLIDCINQMSFSSIPLEKNQWHLLFLKNELKKLTGKIASSFSDQLSTVEKIEDLLAGSIYKVNPLVLKKPFDPSIDNLSSKVIENAMKRKRESEVDTLSVDSRLNFRKYLKPTIVRNGRRIEGGRVYNPKQQLEVWSALFDSYSLIVQDEIIYSLTNLPFFNSFKDFEDWFRKKKIENKSYYEAVLQLLTKISKMRYQAYESFMKNQSTADECDKILQLKKDHIVTILPSLLKKN